MPRKRGLSPKQLRFVQEYLLDLNATQAAIRAGYSARTARQQGQRLLTNVDIAEAIAKAQKKRAERAMIDAEEVLRRLDRESRRCGKGSSHAARVQALTKIGDCLGMFVKKVQLTGANGGPVALSLRDMTDAELDGIIAEGEASAGGEGPQGTGAPPA